MNHPENPSDIVLVVTKNCKPGRFLAVASYADLTPHRDTLSLDSEPARKRFIRGALGKLLATDASIKTRETFGEHLENRLIAYAQAPPGLQDDAGSTAAPAAGACATDPRLEALDRMGRDVKAEAEALLADPNILNEVAASIRRRGVTGEVALVKSLYLVGVSTQLPRPLSAIVRGSSASGKSYALDRVANLFPPEVVLHTTDLTPNALYYFPPGTLRHRWVVAGERSRVEDDERAQATRALREMIESGRLSKSLPLKLPDGRFETVTIEQQGPIAFCETTTLGRIFTEDANRCLLLNTDETHEQTRRIITATAEAAARGNDRNNDHEQLVHQALIRMLPRCDVVVPFAEALGELFPEDRLDARRHFRHLLQMVKAVALLRFTQRDRDDNGNVFAQVEDYRDAAELAATPLAVARGGLPASARRFFDAIDGLWENGTFTTTEAGKKADLRSKSTVIARLNELDTAGLVEQTEPPKGNVPARWRLTGEKPQTGNGGLPTVQELNNQILHRTRGCSTEPVSP